MTRLAIRHVAASVLAVALTVAVGRAFSQRIDPPPPARAVKIDEVLDAWVKQSSRIKTLSAKFTRSHPRPVLGSREYLYEVHWKDSGQAVLNVAEVTGKKKTETLERVVWTGREVWQYNPRKKEVTVWPRDQIGEYEAFRELMKISIPGHLFANQVDLIFSALGDLKKVDPLPFVIDLKKTLAKQRFQFELFEDPDPKRFLLRARALDPAGKSPYDAVLITLDREHYVPTALVYQSGGRGKEIRRYTFLEIDLNSPIADAVFEPEHPPGWKVIKSPLE